MNFDNSQLKFNTTILKGGISSYLILTYLDYALYPMCYSIKASTCKLKNNAYSPNRKCKTTSYLEHDIHMEHYSAFYISSYFFFHIFANLDMHLFHSASSHLGKLWCFPLMISHYSALTTMLTILASNCF